LLDAHARKRERQDPRGAFAPVFDKKRNWVNSHTKRLCKLAGVPSVTAHSLRGMHATLAAEVGSTAEQIAATLGHGSTQVTEAHYIRPGVMKSANVERAMKVLFRATPAPGEDLAGALKALARMAEEQPGMDLGSLLRLAGLQAPATFPDGAGAPDREDLAAGQLDADRLPN
jgi:hypothetical protein